MRAVKLHQQNPLVLNQRCRLTQIDLYNGCKTGVWLVYNVIPLTWPARCCLFMLAFWCKFALTVTKSVHVCVCCVQPPTPEQLEVDIKIENIKKEISDLVGEVSYHCCSQESIASSSRNVGFWQHDCDLSLTRHLCKTNGMKMWCHFSEQRWEWSGGCVALS